MSKPETSGSVAALAVVLALTLVPALAEAQSSGFQSWGTYVALGDSLGAGFSNGSLVVSHQLYSYPAQIARQASVASFQQPTVSQPGLPPELVLVSLIPSTVIAPKSATSGSPTNAALPTPYNNLCVPGATVTDLLTRRTDGGGSFDLVLRGKGTALEQALALRPTAVTLWIGGNDVLGAVVRGTPIEGVTMTPVPVFRAAYQQLVTALKTTSASIVAGLVPDVTTIAFVTAIPRYVVNPSTQQPVLVNGQPVPLIGPNGPLPEGSYVTLAASSLIAQGIGVPVALGGRGTPLPGEVVLDPNEVAILKDRVNAFNQAIREICQAAGIPVWDTNATLGDLAAGRSIGGVKVSGAFLTGGVFSYDGVHLTDLGYAIVANELIETMNANGGKLEPVDLEPLMRVSAHSARPSVELTTEAWESLLAAFPTLDRR